MDVTWKVSYKGEVEYIVGGKVYSVRYWSHNDGHYNKSDGRDYYDYGIEPAVGTVRYDDSRLFHTFPPKEVVALFPGFVGARYAPETFVIEYDGPAPELVKGLGSIPEYVYSRAAEEAESRRERVVAV